VERRLAAILAADVVGYTRLMGADETGTLRRLTELRQQVLEPLIAEHHGRIVKLMGDGLLVEFASVVNALTCAVAWQNGVAVREAAADEDKRLKFRIGINLGDVIVEGDDIHGDGVNIAARLEGQAEPGGICLSGDAYRQAKGKVEIDFEDLGERDLKNVAEPVRVYRIAGDSSGMAGAAPAKAPLALPDKPSIAVLPFANMSGDPEQEYFSDSITEDIITELSRFSSLFVIARNSSFTFKGEAVNVTEVGEKLGVAYVVEGSVRRAGNRVRITAQLVEAENGNHLWAERYDRDLEDIFAVQDEVVRAIASAVPGRIDAVALQRVQRKPIENLTAYDLVLRGKSLLYQNWSSREAMTLFEKAIEIDPQCARAYSHLANGHAYSIFGQFAPADEARRLTRDFAEPAVRLDPNDPVILAMIAEAYLMVGDVELAHRHMEKAIKLNPNDSVVLIFAGVVQAYTGDIEEGLRWNEKLIRHDPLTIDAVSEQFLEVNYLARRYDDAIDSITGWHNPPIHLLAETAAAYSQAGRMDEAQAMRRKFESNLPEGYDVNSLLTVLIGMCTRQEDRDNWIEGFRKAGFEV
jgi:TolB-like protein